MTPSLPEKVLAWYEDKELVRALAQLIPYGGGVDAFLTGKLEDIRRERIAAFFEALAANRIELSEEVIGSEEFLHKYFITAKAAINTRRREKIALFGNLLANGALPSACDADEYEDILRILDELSFRELRALSILDSFSKRSRDRKQNDLQWTETFWAQFERMVGSELALAKNQVRDFMNRIARTGCYEMFTGGFMDYTGGKGKLTPTYHNLKKFVSAPK